MTAGATMRIDQILGHGKPNISFDFSPPKTEAGFTSLFQTVEELKPLRPSYVSVTYGAGGSTRQKTVQLVERIQSEAKIRSMAHLTCVGHTADEIGGDPHDPWEGGGPQRLPPRRGPPTGQARFLPPPGGLAQAD